MAVICNKISYANSAKEMWENFNYLTTYQNNSGGGVLPLLDRNGEAVFNKEEKCAVLEKVFFGGGHLTECTFDEQFKEKVNKAIGDIENDNIPSNDTGDKENCDKYLNFDISIDEVETVLQQLKNNKSPGPDNVFTELLKNVGEEFIKNTQIISEILAKSYSPNTMETSGSEIPEKKGEKELS